MTTVRISRPDEIIALLPYELGYHPRDSLVLIGVRAGRLGLRARVDLPEPGDAADLVASVLPPFVESDAGELVAIGYESAPGAARPVLAEVDRACHRLGFGICASMVVRDGRWFSLDCHDPTCCPPEGRPLPTPDEVPAVAEFVAREVRPFADRAALVDSLRPDRPLLAAAVEAEAAAWFPSWAGPFGRSSDSRTVLDAWSRVLDTSDDAGAVADLGARALAVAAASLVDLDLRDGLIAWLCPGLFGFENVPRGPFARWPDDRPEGDLDRAVRERRRQERLGQLCRCLSPSLAVAPLTVLAAFAWWRGDGTLTRIALDQALDADPDYRLAGLLLRMVDLSIRPGGAERATA